MQTKNVGILAGIAVVITIVGVWTVGTNIEKDNMDKLSVDYETVGVLLENDMHVLVVDIRSAEQYQKGHLDSASYDQMDPATLEKRAKTIQNRLPEVASNYNFVLVDDDGIEAKKAAQTMTEMGIQTFYLDGGINNISESLESGSYPVITSQELSEKLATNEDIYLLDVREPDELLKSKIDASVNIPLAEIFKPNQIDEIPTDKPVVVICGSGNRATIASYALAQEDIDFQILEGGINAWDSFQELET